MDDIQQTRNQIKRIDRNIKYTKWVIRLSILSFLLIFMSSCACYHCPRVYKDRSVPTGIAVPYKKNMKQNKYSPKKPYYGKPEKKKRVIIF